MIIFALVPFVLFLSSCMLMLTRFRQFRGNIVFFNIINISFVFCFGLFSFLWLTSTKNIIWLSLFDWITIDTLDLRFAFMFDFLTGAMLFAVLSVSLMVHLYSVDYMANDPGLPRFLSYLSLFTFFMIILICGENFLVLFLGWEGVGLCSYLLINFWYTRMQANKAAIKAMLLNRIGDCGLLFGIFLCLLVYQTGDYASLTILMPFYTMHDIYFLFGYANYIEFVGIFLFIGAIGKSAQILLHMWLPDAMEGPSPVSALIHAATMVTAGVFLLIRLSFLFNQTPFTAQIIVSVGGLTALWAAYVGANQYDMKKIIAYSTCSQLGYMFICCGLGLYNLALFHLVVHAFFKALLFLTAGVIIHEFNNEQDIRHMNNLIRLMPFPALMLTIGGFSLAGMPFFSGSYSKESVVELILALMSYLPGWASVFGVAGLLSTLWYNWQLFFYCNLGTIAGAHRTLNNNSNVMGSLTRFVFVFLGIASVWLGYFLSDIFTGFGLPAFAGVVFFRPALISLFEWSLLADGVCLNAPLILLMSFVYGYCSYKISLCHSFTNSGRWPDIAEANVMASEKFYFDKTYANFIMLVLCVSTSISYKTLDKGVVEAFGSSSLKQTYPTLSITLSRIQSGRIADYIYFTIIGLMLINCLYWVNSVIF